MDSILGRYKWEDASCVSVVDSNSCTHSLFAVCTLVMRNYVDGSDDCFLCDTVAAERDNRAGGAKPRGGGPSRR
jgi:hypothetical protein